MIVMMRFLVVFASGISPEILPKSDAFDAFLLTLYILPFKTHVCVFIFKKISIMAFLASNASEASWIAEVHLTHERGYDCKSDTEVP